MVPSSPDTVQKGKIKIPDVPDVQKPPRWKSPTSEQVRHCQINCTNTLEVRVCNIQPIQRSHGQSGFQLHRLYPKYHKVKTNRKGQFVSGSFLNIPLLLQSQGIGTFPCLKNAVDKRRQLQWVVSPSAKSQSHESHEGIQHEQLQQGQTEKANLWRNPRIPTSLVPRDKIPAANAEQISEFSSQETSKEFYLSKSERNEEYSGTKAQKPYNLLQEFQQTENQNCQQQGYSHHQSTKSRSLTIFCKRFSNQKIIFVISISLSKMLQHTSQVE